MVYFVVALVAGIHLAMQTLRYYSSSVNLWHGGRTIFRDVFTGIGAEVTEQVEFGAFQKLGDRSTKKQGAI